MAEFGINNTTTKLLYDLLFKVIRLEKLMGVDDDVNKTNDDTTSKLNKDDTTSKLKELEERTDPNITKNDDFRGMPIYEGSEPLPQNFKELRNIVMHLAKNNTEQAAESKNWTDILVQQSKDISDLKSKIEVINV